MHWPRGSGSARQRSRKPKSFHPATWEAWWMVINYLHMCTTTLPHFNAIDTHLISWAPWPHARTQEQDIGELLPTHVPELGATHKKCFGQMLKLRPTFTQHVPELGATRKKCFCQIFKLTWKKCFCKIFKLTHPTCTGTRLTGATCKKYKKLFCLFVYIGHL